MKEHLEIFDLKDVSTRRRLMEKIQHLPPGLYEVYIKERKLTRSLSQNAYWWSALVGPFTSWLREAYGDPRITKDQAHELLKAKVMGVRDMQLPNGEVLELVPSSRTLDTEEFTHLIDAAAQWLAEFCGIVVIPSEMFVEDKTKKRSKAA